MELREWLIILGLILMAIIVIDGVRRLQRQRQSSPTVSPSDTVDNKSEEAVARETAWELPNGGARVVESATVSKPERQESAFERRGLKTRFPSKPADESDIPDLSLAAHEAVDTAQQPPHEAPAYDDAPDTETYSTHHHTLNEDEPKQDDMHSAVHDEHDAQDLSAVDETLAPEPLDIADGDDQLAEGLEEEHVEDPRYEGLSEILWRRPMDGIAHFREAAAERREKRAEAREDARIKRLEARERRAEEKERRKEEKRKAQEAATREQRERDAQRGREAERDELLAPLHDDDPLFSSYEDEPTHTPAPRQVPRTHERQPAPSHDDSYDEHDEYQPTARADAFDDGFSSQYPDIARAKRHLVDGQHARQVLASASDVIAIAVMARDKVGFDGLTLLKLLLACGLRYCTATRVFHRFEADDDNSPLQFTVIDTLKPGEFPLDDMAQFTTAGVWLLMPMPGPEDVTGAFDAMYETARVMARYLDGELRDENQNAMTAQTVDFARQRAQEFERRTKLYHASR